MREIEPKWIHPRTLAVLALAGTIAACGTKTGDTNAAAADSAAITPSAMPADSTAAPGAMATNQQLSDAQIMGVLVAADSGEIKPSTLAESKASSSQVKEFAQRMVKDHGQLENDRQQLAQQQNIMPASSPLQDQLQATAQSTMQTLQGLSGAAFDSVYVQYMVQSHQGALDAIDNQLIPSAQNAQLKTALQQNVRPVVADHLQRIQQIQQGMMGGATTTGGK